MKVEKFVEVLNSDYYVGVPDSQLKSLCGYLMNTYGLDPEHHIIAANEGNCVGIAAGYHLATGRIPVVYMQNSGEGNAINPLASLMNQKVYAIPCILVIGWRGEPGVHDEPQHIYQGEITLKLLDVMGIEYFVVGKETTEKELADIMSKYNSKLSEGHDVAFVIKKNALTYDKKVEYKNKYTMTREEAIKHIVDVAEEDLIISTTGKASRELFEIRENNSQGHDSDFLTVGSMGHSSSIALGVAIQRPNRKVWCIDGDGALLMHMGAMAVIGANAPKNMVHIVINNESHESVGGMPTVAGKLNIVDVAKACGYKNVVSVDNVGKLKELLNDAKIRNELSMIEIKCSIGAREDLGRPTISTNDNKKHFMDRVITL